MRKLIFLVLGTILVTACNSNSPKAVAEKSIECIIDEDFDGYVDLNYFKKSSMEDIEEHQRDKELMADLMKSKYYRKNDSLHIKDYKFISEEIKDSVASVKLEVVNKKGEKDTMDIKLKINHEGDWRITNGI